MAVMTSGSSSATWLTRLVAIAAALSSSQLSAQPLTSSSLAALQKASARVEGGRKTAAEVPESICLDVADVVVVATHVLGERRSEAARHATEAGAPAALDRARDLFVMGRGRASAVIVGRALDGEISGASAARAHFIDALIALDEGRGESALQALADMSTLGPANEYVELARARAYLMVPDYAAGIDTYRGLVAQHLTSRVTHEATTELAHALFASGRYRDADKALAEVIRRYPEYPRLHIALYQRAMSLLRTDRRRRGALLLQRVWLDYPFKEEGARARALLDSETLADVRPPRRPVDELLERARALRRAKHWRVATEELDALMSRVRTSHGSTSRENEIRLEHALVAYEMQDYERALPELQDLVRRATTRGQGAGLGADWVRTLLRRCHHRMGDSVTAEAMLKEQVAGLNNNVRERRLGDFYFSDGRYELARKHYERSYHKADRAGWSYAYLLYKSGDTAQASRMLERLARHASGDTRARYLYWMARSQEKGGHIEDAETIFESVAAGYELSYYGYQARNRILDIAERGETIFPEPDSSVVADASELESSEWSTCEGADAEVLASFPPTLGTDPGVLASRGANPTSKRPSQPAGHPARVHWTGPTHPPEAHFSAPASLDNPLRLSGAGAAYRDAPGVKGASGRMAEHYARLWPALDTVAFLYGVGLLEDAQEELRDIALEFEGLNARFDHGVRPRDGRPLALNRRRWAHFIDHRGASRRGFWGIRSSASRYPVPKSRPARQALVDRQRAIYSERDTIERELQLTMMEVGDYHMVRRMRLGHGQWWRSPPNDDNASQWSEAYPRAFPQWVQKYAAREGLNPYLLWALMTVESAYNPDSVSYANARGLLQVIPKTGNKVAEGVGDPDFGPYDLLDPETSIRHGSWYFARLVAKFNGQEPLAIASYNGGPHNVARWLKHKTQIPLDEFVEEIPFDQARGYTKKVLRFLALFRRLYEGRDDLYVGQVLVASPLVEPRY